MQEWIAIAALIVAAASFAMHLYNNKTNGVWDLSDRLNNLDRDRDKQLQLLYNHVDIKNDEAINKFGETIKGHAEHMRQLELDVYKNFVRIESFNHSIEQIYKMISDGFDRIEKRLSKMEIS